MKGFLAIVIVPLLIAFASNWYFGKEPIVEFSLSNKLRPKISNDTFNSGIQELTIFNRGSRLASNIRILIDRNLNDFDYEKGNLKELPKIKKDISGLVVEIESLQPTQKFRAILTSVGIAISDREIKIIHDEGVGKSVYEKDLGNSISIASICFLFFYIVMSFWSAGEFAVSNLEKNATYDQEGNLLKRSRPFYIFDERKWRDARKTSISSLIDRKSYSPRKLEDLSSSIFLRDTKPENLTDEEWQLGVELSISKFKNLFIERAGWSFDSLSRFRDLFLIEKPRNFPMGEWETLRKKLHSSFFSEVNESAWLNLESSKKIVEGGRWEGVDEEPWKNFEMKVRERYYREKMSKVFGSSNVDEAVKQIDLNFLLDGDREKLKSFVQEVRNSKDKIQKANEKETLYSTRLVELEKETLEVSQMGKRLSWKLETLGKFIDNPRSILEIEEHENFFSPGRFEKLKKFASKFRPKGRR